MTDRSDPAKEPLPQCGRDQAEACDARRFLGIPGAENVYEIIRAIQKGQP